MSALSTLLVVKVLGIAALGGVFVWWQFRDLAREKKRSQARRQSQSLDKGPPN